MKNIQREIRKQSFATYPENNIAQPSMDYGKMRIGLKTVEDAILNINKLTRINPRLADKEQVLRALYNNDLEALQEISNFFFKTCGIYSRLCKYMANLYRYDWMVTPYLTKKDSVNKDKLIDGFDKVLRYLDKFNVKRVLGDIALKVVKNGCYYGYIIPTKDSVAIQELPIKYCRSQFTKGLRPVVSFNMRYFDDKFKDTEYRQRILNLFPKEFKKGYELYKKGKLPGDYIGDTAGWYTLDVDSAIKFNLNGEDIPLLLPVIPAIIDLEDAQELDKKKMQQRLLKIIIQKLPLDKNGDLVFDPDEAKELHMNAVQMLGKAIGLDVLTTFADTEVADMDDRSATTGTDELERMERAVYNAAGVSQMQFNTDGNIALEKSILNDEAAIYNLLLQFQDFLNYIITPFNTNKKIEYNVQLLTTTIYNYKDMAKLYKEQTQMGYSKMLPQIALGQSQRSVLANAYFENDILELFNVFIPPLTSNTMSADNLTKNNNEKTGKDPNANQNTGDNKEGGRPELADEEKSEKTIQNIESKG